MGKYFGTDGIRGRANDTLTAERAFQVGRYLGYYYSQENKGKMLIGKDTRLSGDMLEAAVAAGATASGCDVSIVGVCPTPAISYLAKEFDFDCGVMISASHNPYYDNGIKVFSHAGVKIDAELESEIESFIDGEVVIPYATNEKIGSASSYEEGLSLYLSYLKTNVPLDLSGMKIAVDLANGSATTTARELLEFMGATVGSIGDQPDGININTQVGSTHPEKLQEFVVQEGYDLGFAFDGDADRLIAVDDRGELVDGDKIIYLCGKYLKEQGQLYKNTVVTTVMANLGLYKALEAAEIQTVKTQVGDKYVYESMELNDYVLGGEQSGHIIFKELATTGDGLLTALKILEVVLAKQEKLSALVKDLFIYPQLLVNTPVKNKEKILADEDLIQKIEVIEEKLGEEGRILVRPSGTEPLIRVMVEAKTKDLCHEYVYEIIDFIRSKEENN